MDLLSEYKRQFAWRDWQFVFGALPSVDGQTILDLGCGVGDLAAELVTRGARVIGFDTNEELINGAASRQLPNAEFRLCNLHEVSDLGVTADGIWSSFSVAYFPDLPRALAGWARSLRRGGWIALTEIDDLFGHEPLSDRTKAILNAYAEDALDAGRYDFHMGHKLSGHLEESGFTDLNVFTLADLELSFTGSARPDVLDGWRKRFERMKSLQEFCGAEFEQVRTEFLTCLTRPDHTSKAAVCVCIGRLSR